MSIYVHETVYYSTVRSSLGFSGGHGARDLTTGGSTAGERRTALQHNTTHTCIAGQPRSRACST